MRCWSKFNLSGKEDRNTWDFNQLFSQGSKDISGKTPTLKRHQSSASSLTTEHSVGLPMAYTGSDPAGHRHVGGRAGTRMHTTSLQQRRHVARPETTGLPFSVPEFGGSTGMRQTKSSGLLGQFRKTEAPGWILSFLLLKARDEQ